MTGALRLVAVDPLGDDRGGRLSRSAWLFGIARHQLGRYARTGRVRRRAVERLGIRLPEVSEHDHEHIVELAGLAEMRDRVATAFSGLSGDQREALRLRVIDERP